MIFLTEIAKEFLEDVNVGDYIKIRYGTDLNQETAEGTVDNITENFLKLKKREGGTAKIRLDDSLRSLDIINSNVATTDSVDKKNNFEDQVPARELPAIKVETKPHFEITRNLMKLEPANPYHFDSKEQLQNIKIFIKRMPNKNLLNEMNRVLNALDSAIKNKQVSYKYHDLRAKLLRTWEICNSDEEYELFYLFVGVLAVVAEDYDYALESLIRAKKYSLAAYVSSITYRSNETEIFKFCALLSKQESNIDQSIADICVKRRDSDVLQELLENNRDNEEFCEKLAACAQTVFLASNGELTANIDSNFSAYDTTKQLLNSVPDSWKNESSILQQWKEYQNYHYPEVETLESTESESQLVGKIYRYENVTGKNWGFISPGHYFYIKQVYDNSERGLLLRKMLFAGLWNQLEVSFRLGESSNPAHQSAASHIELTDLGYEEAKRRLEDGETSEKTYNGFVEVFYAYPYMNGRIQSEEDGKQYKFILDSIIDPWLKAYYANINDFSSQYQEVTFEILGKDKATNICWRNQSEDYHELYDGYVTDEDLFKWNAFLNSQHSKDKKILLPKEDPYQGFYYVALPELKEKNKSNKPQPFGTMSIK